MMTAPGPHLTEPTTPVVAYTTSRQLCAVLGLCWAGPEKIDV